MAYFDPKKSPLVSAYERLPEEKKNTVVHAAKTRGIDLAIELIKLFSRKKKRART